MTTGYTIRRNGEEHFYPSNWTPSDGDPPPWAWNWQEGDVIDTSRMPMPKGEHMNITDCHVTNVDHGDGCSTAWGFQVRGTHITPQKDDEPTS